jgi:hypothetical protein
MPAAKKDKVEKLKTIVRGIALGLTVEQSCALVQVSHDWFTQHTKPGSEHEQLRDAAQAAMIQARLKAIDKIGKDAHRTGDYKTALNAEIWRLEKIYRRQYGPDERGALGIQNNTFVISYEQAKEIEAMRTDLLPGVQARLGLSQTNGDDEEHG